MYFLKMAYRGRLRSKWVPLSGLKYLQGENDLKGQKYTSTTFFYQIYLVDLLHNFYSQLRRSAMPLNLLTGLNGCMRRVVTVCMTTSYFPLSDCSRLRGALLHGKTVLLQF